MMDVNLLVRKTELFAELDPNMQLSTMLVFIFIAQREGCTQKDIETNLNMTNGSASRNVSYWCDYKIRRVPGKGFIHRVEDENDRRTNKLFLTQKGRDFYNKLINNPYRQAA